MNMYQLFKKNIYTFNQLYDVLIRLI